MSVIEPVAPQEEFVRCRTLLHAWDVLDTATTEDLTAILTLRCVRCTTLRRDVVDELTGKRIGRPRYVYPKGYKRSRGATDEKMTKNEWRRMFLKVAGIKE